MRVFDNNPKYNRQEDRHLFVVIANDAVRDNTQVESQSATASLRDMFVCMDEAVEASLKLKLTDCGFHGHLPWLDSLVTFSQCANPSLRELVPMTLVDHLESYAQESLLTDFTASQKISQLRNRLSNRMDDTGGESTRTQRSPRVESPEVAYFSRARSTGYSHRPELSTSSSSRPLMPSAHSPTSLTSWHEDNPVELGTMPFPTPVTPDISPVFAYHTRGGTWPS